MSRRAMHSKPSRTRIIGVEYDPGQGEDVPTAIADLVEKRLARAQRDGVVLQYDVDQVIWFEGPPGASMRVLRKDLETMISANGCPCAESTARSMRRALGG